MNYIFYCIVLICIFILYGVIARRVDKYILMYKHKSIISLCDHFLEMSFGIIYTDQIIGFTSNGHSNIPDNERETIERNFIKLTLSLMGPTNIDICTRFYGTKTAFFDNMLFFIRRKMDEDTLSDMIKKIDMERG